MASVPPDYDLEKAMSCRNVILVDTHCHLDFLFKRIVPYPDSFYGLRKALRTTFPMDLRAIVTVFCQPQKWMKVRAGYY